MTRDDKLAASIPEGTYGIKYLYLILFRCWGRLL